MSRCRLTCSSSCRSRRNSRCSGVSAPKVLVHSRPGPN
jgi:hypothetical protein